ncbi:LOW QUALITY PROTEIN: transposase, partial [Enterococcus faecalis Fly1]
SKYSDIVHVLNRVLAHVKQLFDYISAFEKIIYTTNVVKSVHSSFRKVKKKNYKRSRHAF